MKKHEIDRWMRRQARMNNQTSMPAVDWLFIVSVLVMGAAILLIIGKVLGLA